MPRQMCFLNIILVAMKGTVLCNTVEYQGQYLKADVETEAPTVR